MSTEALKSLREMRHRLLHMLADANQSAWERVSHDVPALDVSVLARVMQEVTASGMRPSPEESAEIRHEVDSVAYLIREVSARIQTRQEELLRGIQALTLPRNDVRSSGGQLVHHVG